MRPPFRFPEDLITLRRQLIARSGTLCTHPHWTTRLRITLEAAWPSVPIYL
ncbi:hypothetical protein [Streptomyces virginiae]|uniref:hypothetical protein n=1 Tax=Streptomyces virginiae TaxID=1961 RepID=UPI003253DB7A